MTRAAPARPDSDARRAGVARMALSPDEAAIALGVSRSFFFAESLPLLADTRKGAAHGDR
jgi:hypothetical protein